MDPVTHAALGAALAQAALGRFDKKIPWKVGALAGLAPDLDVLIRFSEPLSGEVWHRSFTHSLFFIPFGGLIVALILCCVPSFRSHWRLTCAAALLGYATHGLLDACTTYGTQLFWPWPNRISWDVVAIIDPWVTIPLVLGTTWSVVNKEQNAVISSLMFVALFFMFNLMQHQKAINAVSYFAQQKGWELNSIRAIPSLASSTQWQIIARRNKCILIAKAYTPLWGKSSFYQPIFTQHYLAKTSTLLPSQQKTLNIFRWFTEDYVIIAKTNPLTLADARFTFDIQPLYSLWGIQFLSNKPYVRDVRGVLIEARCDEFIARTN